jgi:hypothetical protein
MECDSYLIVTPIDRGNQTCPGLSGEKSRQNNASTLNPPHPRYFVGPALIWSIFFWRQSLPVMTGETHASGRQARIIFGSVEGV